MLDWPALNEVRNGIGVRCQPQQSYYAPSRYFGKPSVGPAYFEGHNCLSPVDDQRLGNMLRQCSTQTLLFLGDSLTMTHFYSFVDHAWRLLHDSDSHGSSLPQSGCSLQAHCLSGEWQGLDDLPVHCVQLHEKLNACLAVGGAGRNLSMVEASAILRYAGWLKPTVTLVANIGAHAHSQRELAVTVREFLREIQSYAPASRPRLLWRETAPAHFPTATGAYSDGWKPPSSHDSQSAYSCAARPNTDNTQNELSNAIVRAAHVPVLPVWHATNQRWMEHFGGNDCRHFRLPSAAVELWDAVLIEHISTVGERGDG